MNNDQFNVPPAPAFVSRRRFLQVLLDNDTRLSSTMVMDNIFFGKRVFDLYTRHSNSQSEPQGSKIVRTLFLSPVLKDDTIEGTSILRADPHGSEGLLIKTDKTTLRLQENGTESVCYPNGETMLRFLTLPLIRSVTSTSPYIDLVSTHL